MTEGGEKAKFSAEGLGLLVTLVTANIRSLQFCASKIAALESLTKVAAYVSNEIILDRILPYVVRAAGTLGRFYIDLKYMARFSLLPSRW